MNIFAMAFRNVLRNRHRTVTTVLAMAFAAGLMIFYASLMEGFVDSMEKNAVGVSVGEIQIHAEGYRDDPDLYKRIENYSALIKKLEGKGFRAVPRLYGFGLAAAKNTSSGVMIEGVDLIREPLVTTLNLHILEGAWFSGENPKEVVIGRKLARSLGVGIGDEVVIVGQAADGSMANDLFYVRGILKSVGEKIDLGGFLIYASAFRELMVLPHGTHEMAVVRQGTETNLKDAVKTVSKIASGYETKSWRELMPVLARMLDVSKASLLVMLFITYIAIGMVALNSMLMSVFERIREFGIMKAIGAEPFVIVKIIFTEAVVQVFAASVLAVAFGVPVSLYYETHGIDLTSLTGSSTLAGIGGVAFDAIWYCHVTPFTVTAPLIIMTAFVLTAVIYPGVKAAFIRPVEALHHI